MGRFASRLMVAILLALPIGACTTGTTPGTQSSVAKTSGDEGSSFERAVILADAKTEMEGVRAEHKWVQSHYPGWSWDTQYLVNHEGRAYDVIEISRGGESRKLYFDISNWFGKLG
jgi:hypothetical protein